MAVDDFRNIKIHIKVRQIPIYTEFFQTSYSINVFKTITVSAMYFINKPKARLHYASERTKSNFNAIVRALNRKKCKSILLNYKGGAMSCGKAVEFGKSSPSDIKKFVEKAIEKGSVERYAKRKKKIKHREKLLALPESKIQEIVQAWIKDNGVGVDCSGFVLQAAIENRELARNEAKALSAIAKIVGIEYAIPSPISRNVRKAKSFKNGPKVTSPTALRHGDAWVVSSGGHIRIVTAVREIHKNNKLQTIEFDTDESAGTSKKAIPGPTSRTWRTKSSEKFNPIKRVGRRGGNTTGSFHRIP